MKQLIAKFIADEQGQDIIEYALIGSFVAFGAYLGASALGHRLQHLVLGPRRRGRLGSGQGRGRNS